MYFKKLTIVAFTFCFSVFIADLARPAGFTKGTSREAFAPALKPGDYVWHPEVSPAGPVVIIVSIPDQVMFVYRNGVRIGRSTVSTGAPGHRTPTGVFTVLQKKVDHESSIYKGSKMPHMQRLTWTGIAMHAGQLPGYPASHGCVRLPVDFASKVYTVTNLGTTVIVTDGASGATTTTNPGLLLAPKPSGGVAVSGDGVTWMPEKAPQGPVSIIISTADQTGYVYRNGVEIGRAPVAGLGRVAGTHIYSALASVDANGRRDWISTASTAKRAPDLKELASRASISPTFTSDVRAIVSPGTALVLTDMPVSGRTRSGKGFNILKAE